MIRIDFEASGKTPMGYGTFTHSDYIHDEYRDIATVEKTVKKMASFLRNKAFNGQTLTLVYVNKSADSTLVSRFIHDYDDKYTYVIWEGVGKGSEVQIHGITKKRICEMYLEFANYAIARDAEGGNE